MNVVQFFGCEGDFTVALDMSLHYNPRAGETFEMRNINHSSLQRRAALTLSLDCGRTWSGPRGN
jgi:hypothetical protein